LTPNLVFIAAVQLLLLLFAVSLHGAAQAWMAALCGDPTASQLGGTSLNPLRHFEVMGSLMFPALLLAFGFPLFGWGRPLPVVDANLRRPGWDGILVALAGPAANLLLSAAATVALIVGVHVLGAEARQAAFASLTNPLGADKLGSFPVMFTLVRMASINACVAAFQLIPLPPLDGGQIALRLLPPDWAARLAAIRPYGFIIGVPAGLALTLLLLFPFYGLLAVVINLS
jgi:Zn-dependent protease